MNIILPAENIRTKDFKIENGVLYLRHGQSFRNAIYSLTYFMKGKRFCYYCKKRVPRNEITMDHMYPRSAGGPTIPENLIPACAKCNSEKSDMTYEQYQTFLTLSTTSEKREYLAGLSEYKDALKEVGMFEIPYTWITPVRISDIHAEIDIASISEAKFKKVKAHYKKHHNFQKPVVLDRNLCVLDGFHSIFAAKSCAIPVVPAIVLDNVEVRRSSKI